LEQLCEKRNSSQKKNIIAHFHEWITMMKLSIY
jgi:hypothetical protein